MNPFITERASKESMSGQSNNNDNNTNTVESRRRHQSHRGPNKNSPQRQTPSNNQNWTEVTISGMEDGRRAEQQFTKVLLSKDRNDTNKSLDSIKRNIHNIIFFGYRVTPFVRYSPNSELTSPPSRDGEWNDRGERSTGRRSQYKRHLLHSTNHPQHLLLLLQRHVVLVMDRVRNCRRIGVGGPPSNRQKKNPTETSPSLNTVHGEIAI